LRPDTSAKTPLASIEISKLNSASQPRVSGANLEINQITITAITMIRADISRNVRLCEGEVRIPERDMKQAIGL
jgi:hypothetical protein